MVIDREHWDAVAAESGMTTFEPAPDVVRVSWYGCDCDRLTKYCDENHRRYALIPRDVLEEFDLAGPERSSSAKGDES